MMKTGMGQSVRWSSRSVEDQETFFSCRERGKWETKKGKKDAKRNKKEGNAEKGEVYEATERYHTE
jgi:hypothetical protein